MSAEYRTLPDLFYSAFDRWPKTDLVRFKRGGRWVDLSTTEFERRIACLAHAFTKGAGGRSVSVPLLPGDRVALLSENRPEWTQIDFACQTLGLTLVPIYPNLPADQVAYILANSGAKMAIASSEKLFARLLSARASCPELRRLVIIDPPPSGFSRPAGVVAFDELLTAGDPLRAASPEWHREQAKRVTADTLATLIYTSGTTGTPKGVMLTHGNFVSNVMTTCEAIPFSHRDTALSFLPLCHVLERMMLFSMFYRGGTVAYAEGFEAVAANLLEIRPTLMTGVPRFFEKLYEKAQAALGKATPRQQALFRWGQEIGKRTFPWRQTGRLLPPGLFLKFTLARMLIFRPLHEKTGGRLRFFISGGAPLSREIAEFFFAAGFTILEGYGLSETSPVISINRTDRWKPGTVGPPLPNVDVRIAEDGEICVRGPNVMQGYYRLPEATAEALQDGWFHTGDIGHLDPDGFLVITDRKKDLIKTSGGKYVAPQPIENRLKADPFINLAVIVGNSRKFVSALLVPNFERLEAEARARGWGFADRAALCAHPEVLKLYESRLSAANEGQAPVEMVKKCVLLPEEFSIEGGELTPTLKVKRKVVEEKYATAIGRLYGGDPGE